MLGVKIEHTISLSQRGYILEDFNMADCNPFAAPMEENLKLSKAMYPTAPEKKETMAGVPYRELIGKLLYLAVATRCDVSYAVGILCWFVDKPGPLHQWLSWFIRAGLHLTNS
jgi:hypothetical protein